MSRKGKLRFSAILICFTLIIVMISALSCRTVLKILYPVKYGDTIEKYSDEYHVDEALLFAMIKTESSFKPDARSNANALGLAQITPDTFQWLQTKTGEDLPNSALLETDTSIRYGTFFMSLLLKEFGSDETALAAYHAGRGKVNQWLADSKISQDGKTLSEIPYKDTSYYVKKVIRIRNLYRNLYDL